MVAEIRRRRKVPPDFHKDVSVRCSAKSAKVLFLGEEGKGGGEKMGMGPLEKGGKQQDEWDVRWEGRPGRETAMHD